MATKKFYENYLKTAKEKNLNGAKKAETGEKREYLSWKYPSNVLEMKGKKIRILPQNNENGAWFFLYKTHQFKAGSQKKICACMESTDRNGKKWGDCMICRFIEDQNSQGRRLEADTWRKLVSRDTPVMLAYCYDDQKIYLMTVFTSVLNENIVPAYVDLSDEEQEQVESEGFDLYFKTDDNGFATFRKIDPDVPTLEELGLDFDKLQDISKEVKVSGTTKFYSHVYSMLEVAVNTFCPEHSDDLDVYKAMIPNDDRNKEVEGNDSYKKKGIDSFKDEDNEEDERPSKPSKKSSILDEDEDEKYKSKKKSITSKKVVEEDDDEEDESSNDDSNWDNILGELDK